ncbi:Swarming motility protein SwrC [Vibrio mediterranei]|uniref:efflux RND transporter permease subunit n=1 Tax=Vibrio mediterranei TaxID=689 RepID=UPI0007806386|nr:efflux RND transporter permease subunit [Vibrio mediterranei]SBO12509.1 Swarming motility protein SwrC [Vibrio mediterranei]
MDITGLAIRKQRFVSVILVFCLFAGLYGFINIPRAQDPGFPIRTAQIITSFPGASSERVEQLVTDKIETAVQEMPELDTVSSLSKFGVSIVTVDIKDSYKELRPVWDSLRRKVDAVQAQLPNGAGPSVVNDEFGDVFGIVLSVTAEGYSQIELQEIAEQAQDELLRIPSVAKANLYGLQKEEIVIEYDNSRLQSLRISPSYISQFLTEKNIILSGGKWSNGKQDVMIEPTGDLDSVRALQKTYIPIPNSHEVVPLENLAKVYRDFKEPTSMTKTNGKNSIAIALSMIEGGNIIEMGEEVELLIKQFYQIYPWGVEFEVVAFQPELVNNTIDGFISSLGQAVVVVIVVMLLSLGMKIGVIVSSLIPFTIATSIAVMYWAGIGMDQVSLAALMIALGMLVDNSIVMAENILARRKNGESPWDASVNAAKELRVSLLTSSLTTSAAFLPIYLAESTTGEYTAPLFTVVTITLLISWLLSITMIPMFCYFIKDIGTKKPAEIKKDEKGVMSTIESYYLVFLSKILRYRAISLVVIATLFIAAIFCFRYVPVIFFPPAEDPTFKVEIELPIFAPISETERVVDTFGEHLNSLTEKGDNPKGLKNWSVFIGNGGPRYVLSHSSKPASPNYAMFIINTDDSEAVDGVMNDIEHYLFTRFPDVSYKAQKLQNGAAISNPIEVRILGKDTQTLMEIAEQVKSELNGTDGVKGVTDDWGLRSTKFIVNIDEAEALRHGVSNTDVALSLQAATSGLTVSEYREGEDIIPIVMRASTRVQNSIERPTSTNIISADNRSLPLAEIVDTQIAWVPSLIPRRDRLKAVTVAAGLESGVTPIEVNRQLVPFLENISKSWPVGYRWELGGVAQSSGEANKSILEKLPIGFGIILFLLVGQFNSIRKASIILLTIPLGLIGVCIGLNLTGSYLGFMTILGVISLAGIVINNAIVLIDRIDFEQSANGLSAYEAIIEAAKRRMIPILLTTVTTIVGMIPLWFGGGVMWEPMAIAIIFGLLVSTILTLGVVPLLYSIFFKVKTQ